MSKALQMPAPNQVPLVLGDTASTPGTPAKRDAGGNLSGKALVSDVANGTPPLQVISKTKVVNLNVEFLGDKDQAWYLKNTDVIEPSAEGMAVELYFEDLPMIPDGTSTVAIRKFTSANIAGGAPGLTTFSVYNTDTLWHPDRLSIYNGRLKFVPQTNDTLLRIGVDVRSKTVIARIKYSISGGLNFNNDATSNVISFVANRWKTISWVVSGTGSNAHFDIENVQIGATLEIACFYVGDGSFATSLSHYGNPELNVTTGLLPDSIAQVPGRNGMAAQFFGGTSRLSLQGITTDTSDPVWLHFEIYRESIVGTHGLLSYNQGANQGIFFTGTTLNVRLYNSGVPVQAALTTAVGKDKWVDIDIIYDGTNTVAYIDGDSASFDSTILNGLPWNQLPWYWLGQYQDGSIGTFTNGFVGKIQSFFMRINTVPTAGEVKWLARSKRMRRASSQAILEIMGLREKIYGSGFKFLRQDGTSIASMDTNGKMVGAYAEGTFSNSLASIDTTTPLKNVTILVPAGAAGTKPTGWGSTSEGTIAQATAGGAGAVDGVQILSCTYKGNGTFNGGAGTQWIRTMTSGGAWSTWSYIWNSVSDGNAGQSPMSKGDAYTVFTNTSGVAFTVCTLPQTNAVYMLVGRYQKFYCAIQFVTVNNSSGWGSSITGKLDAGAGLTFSMGGALGLDVFATQGSGGSNVGCNFQVIRVW